MRKIHRPQFDSLWQCRIVLERIVYLQLHVGQSCANKKLSRKMAEKPAADISAERRVDLFDRGAPRGTCRDKCFERVFTVAQLFHRAHTGGHLTGPQIAQTLCDAAF